MASAENLKETLKKDFLTCSICFEQLREPVGLPCLHGFCFECLDKWHKAELNKAVVVCPACKQVARVLKDGIRGFPSHFLINNLREAIGMEKTVEKQTGCKLCGKSASVHCFNCKCNLCSKCHESHDAFEFMKEHVVANLADIECGKEMHEGRFCKLHGEHVRYYCETENKAVCMDCINLKRCEPDHERVSLKDAVTKQRSELEKLIRACDAARTTTSSSIQSTKKTQQNLSTARKAALENLKQMKADCYRQLNHDVDNYRQEIDTVSTVKELVLNETLDTLEKHLQELEEAKSATSKLIESNSDFAISYRYTSISENLQSLSKHKQRESDQSLGYVSFEVVSPMSVPLANVLKQDYWQMLEEVELDPKLDNIESIGINNDDMCMSSFGQINVYSRIGRLKHTLQKHRKIYGSFFAITPDNRYVILDSTNIAHFDVNGRHLYTTKHGIKSHVSISSSTVDQNGKIIIAWADNMYGGLISIHYSEGSLMSKFNTSPAPRSLSTFDGNKIVALSYESLQIMDYSGRSLTIIHKPPNCDEWYPEDICCSSHEIFVTNDVLDHACIHRFDQRGRYLGIVATVKANCMAVSKKDNRLYIVEWNSNTVKKFQQQ